jgi:hypothetical protein
MMGPSRRLRWAIAVGAALFLLGTAGAAWAWFFVNPSLNFSGSTNGWFRSDPTAGTLTYRSASAGNQTWYYQVDGGVITTGATAGTGSQSVAVSVAGEGSHLASATVIDGQPWRGSDTATVRIDAHAPISSINLPASTWVTTTVVMITSRDSTPTTTTVSGVDHKYYWSSSDPTTRTSFPADGTSSETLAQGVQTFRYYAQDYAGNNEVVQSTTLWVDTVGPSTGYSGFTNNVWRNGQADVTLTPTDAGSGVASTWYKIGTGSIQSGTSFSVTATGTTVLQWGSVDAVGNRESTKTATVKIDEDAPVTTAGGFVDGGWRNTTAHVTLTPSDGAGSGVASTWYIVGTGSVQSGTSFSVTATGSTLIQWGSVDHVGNRETTKTATINIEKEPPVTSASGDTDGLWRTTPANIVLNPTDTGGSGVASTWYKVGKHDVMSGTEFTVTDTGTVTVQFGSVDNAGNREATETLTTRIDVDGPVTTASGFGDGVWRNTPADVVLSANDGDGSGVADIWFRVDGVFVHGTLLTVHTPGITTIEYGSVDVLGNREDTKTATIKIDYEKPITGASGFEDGAWRTTPADVVLDPVDTGGSGIENTWYQVNDGPILSGTEFTVDEAGTDTISWGSVDVAGNAEDTHTATIKVDGTAPVTEAYGFTDGVWRTSPAEVTLVADDGSGSGVAGTWYRIGDGDWTFGTSFMVDAPGQTTIQWYSEDVAGNDEKVNTATIKIDYGPPVTMASGFENDVWRNTPADVVLTPDDGSGIGVASTWFRIGGINSTGTEFTIESPGVTVIEWGSVDKLGQREDTRTATIKIDYEAPVTTALGFTDGEWRDSAAEVTLDPVDTGGSGLAETWYRIGDGDIQYGTGFIVSDPGTTTIEWGSSDNAGNVEDTHHATIEIDYGPPVTSASGFTDGAWRNTPADVTLTPDDQGGAGVADTWYQIGDGDIMHGTEFTVDSLGVTTIRWASVDNLGKREDTNTATIKIETDPPVTTADGFTDGEWRNTAATVTLDAQDTGGSGVYDTWYSINGDYTHTAPARDLKARFVEAPTGPTFVVSGEGENDIQWASSDNAGNSEEPHSATILIDYTAPTVPSGLTWDNLTSSVVKLRWTGSTDDGSGLNSYRVYLNGVVAAELKGTSIDLPIDPETSCRIVVTAVDNVGNESAPSNALEFMSPGPGSSSYVDSGESMEATAGGFHFVFDNVTTPGTVTVTPIGSLPAAAPESFMLAGGGRFDVSFTGEFTDTITVTIPFDSAMPLDRAANQRIYHWIDGGWVDVTKSVDVPNHTITIELTALSPIGMFEPIVDTSTTVAAVFASTANTAITVNYNATTGVQAQVRDASGNLLPAPALGSMVLDRWDGAAWVAWKAPTSTTDTGVAFQFQTDRNTTVRVRFAGNVFNTTSNSGSLIINTRASLSAPAAPRYSVVHGTWFKVNGLLKPAHLYGARSVVIYAYHYESGHWVQRASWTTRNFAADQGSTYQCSMRFSLTGAWRLRAYHGDDTHAASWSGIRSFAVR